MELLETPRSVGLCSNPTALPIRLNRTKIGGRIIAFELVAIALGRAFKSRYGNDRNIARLSCFMNQTSDKLKIVSFLGFSKYQEVTYLHPNYQENRIKVTTSFYQEALVEFYRPKTLYVLLTPTAEERNWQELAARLEDKVELQPIRNIPENNTPKDIWSIFDRVTDCLHSGDEVIFRYHP